jgi:hypothetical protein
MKNERSAYSICPLICSWQHRFNNSNANNLTKTPAEIDIGGEVSTKSNGTDFRGVCDRESLENAPRNATQDLRNLQIDDTLSREENSRETNDENETGHNCVSVPESLRDEPIDEETNDLSDICTVTQSRLPSRRNLPLATRQLLSILLIKLFEAICRPSAFPFPFILRDDFTHKNYSVNKHRTLP